MLTSDEIRELEDLLIARKADLEARLTGAGATVRPVSLDEPIGRLSRMDAIQQQQMAGASRRQMETALHQVQAALARLAGGSYGICLRCENDIPVARLRVRPEATLCQRCQRSTE